MDEGNGQVEIDAQDRHHLPDLTHKRIRTRVRDLGIGATEKDQEGQSTTNRYKEVLSEQMKLKFCAVVEVNDGTAQPIQANAGIIHHESQVVDKF